VSEGPLLRALGLHRGQAVAAVGAGGKTSLLAALAAECHAAGWRPALLTTTTKIFAPGEGSLLLLGEASSLARTLGAWSGEHSGPLTLARARLGEAPVPGEPSLRRMKLDGFAPGELEALREGAGVLLIEADGARGLPIKSPGPEEPVIPPWAEAVVGVVGLRALGAPLDEAHAFRSDLLRKITGLPSGAPVTAEAVGRLAGHPEGLFKGAPRGARKLVLLNQADAMDLDKLKETAYIIWSVAGTPRGPIERILCASLGGGPGITHQFPAA